jgi:hypothetical protein
VITLGTFFGTAARSPSSMYDWGSRSGDYEDLSFIALMMQAVQTCETLVNPRQSTRRYNPEDSHIHFRSCWNLLTWTVLKPTPS